MENKIKLNDLLKIDDLTNVKIKFNQNNGWDEPMDMYMKNPDIINNQWLFWRSERRYFYVGEIAICVLKLSYDMWLLTTIKRVTKELDVKNGINYEGEELEEYSQFYGRVIIKFRKTFQTQCRKTESIMDELEVVQVLPSIFDGKDFPGYDNTRLTYEQLKVIVDRHKKDWIAALENQKAVYLIRDSKTGKLYVGSATGDNGMLLSRWKSYVANGHGGNIELRQLVEEQGFDYVRENFVYSILENYNSRVDKKHILQRESWWKQTLGTREFGYNSNQNNINSKEVNVNKLGKNINLFLVDGEARGRIKCTLANWTGVVYKIPRTEIDKCKDREDLKQSGVYFLFGISEETDKNVVYIGQAGARKNDEGILGRLQEHKRNSNKDYWTDAVVFTTSNNSFGPTEISFLENKFYELAKECNRYEVKKLK